MKANKDLYDVSTIAAPATRNASANGTGVDLANYGGNMVLIEVGTVTDGTHTPKLQESSDNSSFSDVAAADQVGTLAALASNVNQKVSYIGALRYLRVVMTVAGATTGAAWGAHAILGGKRKKP